MNSVNSTSYNLDISRDDLDRLYDYAINTESRVSWLEEYKDNMASKAYVDAIDIKYYKLEKLLELIYESLGVAPYDSYGNLRPDEEILADLAVALIKTNISIDDILGE